MVKTVISNQLSAIRKEKKIHAESSPDYRLLVTALFLLFPLKSLNAKDFGTHGVIYPIEEKDPIQLIQQRLKIMEERGELERHNREIQKKTKAAIERPKPVEGIAKAQENRTFYFDPTYIVKEDLKDHIGRVFYKKGTKINPLQTINLPYELLFFDGDDVEQKEWAKQKLQQEKIQNKLVRFILVKGAPLSLSEELNTPVYFDQGGLLIKKLKITHVPALVIQEGLRLRIEEVKLGEKQ